MTHQPLPRLHQAQQSPGLVVMLDAAGRTIAGLEDRVDQLTAHIAQLEKANESLRAHLAQATDTARVDPQPAPESKDGPHDDAPSDTAPPAP